jgi:hypothetical protein
MPFSQLDTIWELFLTTVKWVIGAFVASVMFILKGYHREFEELKKSNAELLRAVQHINDNLRQYDNGTKANTEAIILLEKEVTELKIEMKYIKEKLHEIK